jgi:hypothetical protein
MIDEVLTRGVYKGLGMQQRMDVFPVFEKLFKEVSPKRVIEIGTGMGGLTLYFRDILPPEFDLYTFELNQVNYHQTLRDNNIKLYYESIFKEVTDWTVFEVKNEWEHIFDETPKIVICDGGHKLAEFNGLAKYIKPNDIIMLHDYSTDRESFERLNVWNWLECQYSDIKKGVEQNNLKPYMHEEFLNIAWGCFTKEA